jgi:splicing factor U2AF 65 kDa subunit
VYQVGALPTKVVCLTQVVSADELKDDEEYEDIMEDMRLEAGKYGTAYFFSWLCSFDF